MESYTVNTPLTFSHRSVAEANVTARTGHKHATSFAHEYASYRAEECSRKFFF